MLMVQSVKGMAWDIEAPRWSSSMGHPFSGLVDHVSFSELNV